MDYVNARRTEGAALALQSVFYQRQWQYPIMLTEPSYPTVDIYPTRDDRWIMINGGYPKLRDGLLELLNSADSAEAARSTLAPYRREHVVSLRIVMAGSYTPPRARSGNNQA